MKLLIIIMFIAISIFFAFKEGREKNFKKVAVYTVLSALCIGIAGNYIYDELSKTTPPKPEIEDETTPQPPTIISEQTDESTAPLNPPKTLEKVSILKIETYYSDGLAYYEDDIVDNEGNKYIGYATMESGDMIVDYDGEAVYQNNNYKRFTGKVITSKRFKNCDDCGWIRIYGDEELIFDSGKIAKGVSPKAFDLDISSYAEIKIEFKDGLYTTHETDFDYAVARCFLVDSYFHYL